ncbi:MAG: protein kinase, partial [Planctomycetales bacterium]|nr:protein kinase [Planctomycetales bacterium]
IVAIKVYRDPDGVETIDGEQIPIQNYFLNECKSLADLQECAAVPRYHYGVNDENRITGDRIQPFVVMEFVDGMTAEKVGKGLANEADRAERLVELFRKAMVGLQRFHDAGKIHRDISGRNVMLQGDRFRFVDCARAKAIDEVHTGMHTVKGGYTPGYASEELIGERKTPAEDVSELCTVVYEWFTGSNKSESNLPAQWYKRLVAKGSDARLAKIVVKGMTPRNPQRAFDPAVFHSPHEVISALDRLERIRRLQNRLIRNGIGLLAVAAVLLVFFYVSWDRVQHFAYTSELRRLGEQREALANAPRDARADARVQQRIDAAQQLEQRADASNRHGNTGEASSLLAQAVDQIADASRVAANLARLRPLVQP